MQFYLYDWSEMEPADSGTFFEVDDSGRFAPFPGLADYWTVADRWPLVIESDARAVGFALLDTHSHRDGGAVGRNMAEFFVMRQHRRRGVAAAAVREILRQHPGQWEVAVATRNSAANTFWPKALGAADNVSGLHAVEGDGMHWRGRIWCFDAGIP